MPKPRMRRSPLEIALNATAPVDETPGPGLEAVEPASQGPAVVAVVTAPQVEHSPAPELVEPTGPASVPEADAETSSDGVDGRAAPLAEKPKRKSTPKRSSTRKPKESPASLPAPLSLGNIDPRLLPAPKVAGRGKVAFNHRIPPEIKDRIEAHCARTGETQVDMLLRALEVVLEASERAAGIYDEGDDT